MSETKIAMLKSDLHPSGIEMGVAVENGNILMKFSQPVDLIGLSLQELQMLVVYLAHAGHHAQQELDQQQVTIQ